MLTLNTTDSGPKSSRRMMNFITKLTNAGEVLSEQICFNQKIRFGNTFLMHKHWIDKGVHCVAHFLKEEGEVLCHIDFQRKLDITIDFVTLEIQTGNIAKSLTL